MKVELAEHRGERRILLMFEKDSALNKRVRSLPGVRWSRTLKCWHVPDNEENRRRFKLNLSAPYHKSLNPAKLSAASKNLISRPASNICEENRVAMQQFVQRLELKAYSKSTIKTYCSEFGAFLQTLGKKPANELTTERLKDYLQYCYVKLKLSENTIHSRINAIKFYYEQVLGRERFFWDIPRPKKQMQLPRFFNQNEIASIIKASGNLKHKTMLMLAYSSGLRVSEVVNLKTNAIDSKRMSILIRQAKGKKDRIVTLSPVLLVILREYWKKYKPPLNGYLFEGQNKGEPYSTRSLQLVLSAAKKSAGIVKEGSVHALRHSFATHLLDKGTDVTMIMKLLGHNDLKTTLRYLHVTNRDMLRVLSPLDDLHFE